MKRYTLLAVIIAIAFLVFLPHTNLLGKVEGTLSQATVLNKNKEQKQEVVAKKEEPKKDHSVAKAQLLADLQTDLGINQQFSISIYDINNDESFGLNEEISQHSASVTKVLVATTVLEDIEKGKYTLDQAARGYTLQWQLQQMINQSNNNSWDYFNSLLGFKREQQEADKLGLTGVNMFETHMTTKGVSQLLLKLYKGDVLTTEHRDLLFSYMQNTETENRISPAIPPGVSFYHKTGTYNTEIHDAAVIINPKNPFILVIFTVDGTGISWGTRFASFQKATKHTYDYFLNL